MQIKQWRFADITPTSGTTLSWQIFTSGVSSTSEIVLQGQLEKVGFRSNSVGSLFLLTSGNSELLWSNVAPSGTYPQVAYPVVFTCDNINGAGSPNFTKRIMNDSVYLGGSGGDGGSITNFLVSYL